MSNRSGVKVRRFSKGFVVAHGVNAISFLALYITALPMYAHSFSWLFPVLGGPANARLLHRIFACIFVTPTIIYLIMDPKGLALWMKELITWKKRDVQFFTEFVKDLFGFKFKHVRQTFYNAGEKVNSMLQVLCALMIICSGITMWFSQYFPRAVVQWGYLFHDIGFGLAIAVVVGHVYLSVVHKNSRPGYTGVITGEVPAWWAREHHTDWYDEEVAKGNFPKIDKGSKKKEKGA
ncbi:cytochrome b/b6 domain-containing protein [Neobacillus sp. PS3-12]|jgi:formate dehydrogenase subunit gamma|uniref:formate dehydrogenase subunit gamma n=1 Tax=Neobacillus sp. PS3-12 TaxID=3070677 RepID=UPI0027DF727E|nr:cytochrome b/b6 domain-containing protein [Neobacillus sp. PS3-12]WML55343.1 cytochrome b/b6 domain-containing protein [Neobacillus sp. PS3-12]